MNLGVDSDELLITMTKQEKQLEKLIEKLIRAGFRDVDSKPRSSKGGDRLYSAHDDDVVIYRTGRNLANGKTPDRQKVLNESIWGEDAVINKAIADI